ncbi:MAG: hypothetical protein ACLP59_27710 [Bryobacteraceae bacterium]
MRKLTGRFLLTMLALLALGLAGAQAKSDFTGTWKVNLAKSDFGAAPAPDSVVETIVHQEPAIKVKYVQVGGTGDVTSDMVYSTDGKESVNHMGDNEFKTTLKWEGEDLVGETKGSFDGNDFIAKDRWSLADGGKTMIVVRQVSADGADFEMKMVFEKQ